MGSQSGGNASPDSEEVALLCSCTGEDQAAVVNRCSHCCRWPSTAAGPRGPGACLHNGQAADPKQGPSSVLKIRRGTGPGVSRVLHVHIWHFRGVYSDQWRK